MGSIEFNDAVALGIVDPAGEYGCAVRPPGRSDQTDAQIIAIKDVVAKDQRRRVAGEKQPADQECFCNSAGVILDRIGQLDPPLPSVAEQALELPDLFR